MRKLFHLVPERELNAAEERVREESRRADQEGRAAEKSAGIAEQAQKQARMETQRAHRQQGYAEQERWAAANAKQQALESERRAAQAEQQAQMERQNAYAQQGYAEQERWAAANAKQQAFESAGRAAQAEQQAQMERQRANAQQSFAEQERLAAANQSNSYESARRAAEAEQQAELGTRRQLEALTVAETHRVRAETAEQEKQRLLFEKEEKQMRDEKLMQFSWGPKDKAGGQWTTQEFERLRTKFLGHLKDMEGKLIHSKILIFGPSGAGKSAFCNGLRSALRDSDKPATYYAVGSLDTSLTGSFQATQYGDHWIIDMPGIFESSDFKTKNIEAIASGRVPFSAKITKTLEVKGKRSKEKERRDVSCVVLVLHHGIILGEELKRQLNAIIRLGGDGALSYHLVLTHLDDCDPQFKASDNLPNLYTSPLVQEAVKMMSEQTGIPGYAISYVKNYVMETETDTNTKLLHLRALDKILSSAADQVEKRIDQKRLQDMYNE